LGGDDGGASVKLIANIVSDADMSPFEIIHSGLVTALMTYLTPGDVALRDSRLRKFLRVFLSLPVSYYFNLCFNFLLQPTTIASDRLLLSCDVCLEVRGEIIRTVLFCIVY